MNNLTMKFWSEDDQPREKLVNKGKHNLSDAELIAIILNTGTKDYSALDIAKQLLFENNSILSNIAKMNVKELMKIKGIGQAKAISLVACFELGRRRKEENINKRAKITSSNMVYTLVSPIFRDLKHEEFHIVLLDRANQLIGVEFISSGGLAGTYVDGKIVLKKAIDKGAQSLILVHNHPSGTLKPSEQDIDLTKKLKQVADFVDISILDHLIFTDNGYFSFSDQGVIF